MLKRETGEISLALEVSTTWDLGPLGADVALTGTLNIPANGEAVTGSLVTTAPIEASLGALSVSVETATLHGVGCGSGSSSLGSAAGTSGV